jgi:hypothetical protein
MPQTTETNNPSANAPETSNPFVVHGQVRAAGRKSVGSLGVQLYDRGIGADVLMRETITGDDGGYRLEVPAESVAARNKIKPDWVVRVLSGEALLHTSDVRYDAPIEATIDVELAADVTGLPAEYDTLVKTVGSHFAGAHAQLLRSEGQQDITYLANKTGWDAEKLSAMSLADQASAAAGNTVPAALFYALFRAGVPADVSLVCRNDEATLRRLWQTACDQGVIAKPADDVIANAVKQLHAMRVDELLNKPALDGASSMSELLALGGLDDKQKQQFADLYATYSKDLPGFWETARTTFGQETADRLQLHGKLAALTLNNAALVRSLDGKGDTQKLVLAGLHRPKKWLDLLTKDIPIPTAIQGDTPEARRSNYADYLAAQLRLSHPTAAIADIVRSGELPLDHAEPVADFLTEHLGRFEIGVHPVGQYLAKECIALAPETLAQVKRLQRVYQMTQTDQAMAVLLKPETKLDSAYQIVRHTRESFVANFGNQLGDDPAVAERIHDKATQIHATALNVAVSYLTSRLAPPLGLSPDTADGSAAGHFLQPASSQAASRAAAADVIVYPTMEQLFGSVDYAACDPSRSVLSPAAYLVDLLDFIQITIPNAAPEDPQTVQEALFRRRPDIEHLKLTAENTNTVLPYIDLVNEVLEYFVNSGTTPSLDGYVGYDTGDFASEDLLAGPQHQLDNAYDKLKTACFPPPLPYHQPLETLRRYFAQSGMPLAKAMERLRPWNGLEHGNIYGWRDILAEELEISRQEYAILTDSSLTLNQIYGFDAATDALTVIAELSNAKKFCRRVGISYDDLVALLGTRFINPNVDLVPKLQRLGVPFPTLQALGEGRLTDAAFLALLPIGDGAPDPARYGGNIPKWVKDNYSQIASILTLTRAMPGSEVDFGGYELTCAINPALVNSDFEIPALPGSFKYNPTDAGVGWAFSGGAGIQGNGSAWGAENAPIGKQTGFLQRDGNMAQSIALNQGCYLLSFRIARRAYSVPADGVQPIKIIIDGSQIGGFITPSSTSFESIGVDFAVAATGPHTVMFSGTDAADDKSSFIDAVAITARVPAAVFIRLLRFIRLWKKTGWTVEQTDAAICALFKADLSAVAAGDIDTAAKLDAGFKVLLPRLGVVKRTLETLESSVDEGLHPLLACWNDIDTHGASSLYRQLFLNPTISKIDAAFADNGYGEFLIDGSQTLAMHEKALCGAFGLTHEDFALIVGRIGLANAPLTIKNVSALYRHAWLAKKLGLSVQEFLLLLAVLVPAPSANPRQDPSLKWHPFDAPDIWSKAAAASDPFDLLRCDEPPISRFIAWVNKFKELSLDIKETVALIWNLDGDGATLPQFVESTYHELIRTIRADFVAIDVQSSASGGSPAETASARIALAYGRDAGSRFVALVVDREEFSVAYVHAQPTLESAIQAADAGLSYDNVRRLLSHQGRMSATQLALLKAIADVSDDFKRAVQALFDQGALLAEFSVAYTHGQETLEPEIQAVDANLVYDSVQKRLWHKGRMNAAQLVALKAVAGVSDVFKAAVQALFDQGAASIPMFFSRYPDLQSVYNAYQTASGSDADRWTAMLAQLNVVVTEHRKRDMALKRLATHVGTDIESARTLLDPAVPPGSIYPLAGADPNIPALAYAMLIDQQGMYAEFFYSPTASGSVAAQDFYVANLDYSIKGGHPLPVNPAAPAAPISGRWSAWLELPENGTLSLAVEADSSAKVTLTLDGNPQSMAQSGTTTWVSPAIGMNAGQMVKIVLTVENVHDRMSLTWQTQTRSREAIPSRYLYCRSYDTWSFGYMTLLFKNAVDLARATGLSASEIAYLSTLPEYRIQQIGWLNFVPNYHNWGPVADQLASRLRALLEFARIKSAWSPKSENLLTVLKDPMAATAASGSLFYRISGQTADTLSAVLTRVGRSTGDLAKLGFLRYVFDALAPLRALAIPAATTVAATTNEPAATAVAALLRDARANVDASAWRLRVRPVNDELRALQRDALVAYILQAFRLQPDRAHIDTPDKLFEYFLMDVAMEPCMQTSRIRHALSSVQLFIERCMLNLEPALAALFDGAKRDQWTWMKRYRIWEAQRRVFLYPENWLEPELRDDKSPFFKELEEELLQSDITDASAEQAMLNYLAKLQNVSRLQPCGMFVESKLLDPTYDGNDIVHVVAHTFGAHRTYYYRRLESCAWTPWDPIGLDIEGDPVVPVVWNGRLLLFWVRLIRSMETESSDEPVDKITTPIAEQHVADLIANTRSYATKNQQISLSAILCWSEYYNGKWEKQNTAEFGNPIVITTASMSEVEKFDRSAIRLSASASIYNVSTESLIVTVEAYYPFEPARFSLVSTSAAPIAFFPETPRPAEWWQRLESMQQDVPSGRFGIDYYWKWSTDRAWGTHCDLVARLGIPKLIQQGDGRSWVGSGYWSGFWASPFFYQDDQNVFYVEPSPKWLAIDLQMNYGFGSDIPWLSASIRHMPLTNPTTATAF